VLSSRSLLRILCRARTQRVGLRSQGLCLGGGGGCIGGSGGSGALLLVDHGNRRRCLLHSKHGLQLEQLLR
jgi:hypothetical protein